MTTIQKLVAIYRLSNLYDIHFRNAGVGFTFFEPPENYTINRLAYGMQIDHSWKDYLVTHRYYPTFAEAVNAEYRRLKKTKSVNAEYRRLKKTK